MCCVPSATKPPCDWAAKKAGDQEEMQRVLAEVASIGERITSMEKEVDEALAARDAVRMSIPNLLHEAVPSGADESGNTVHSVHGEKPTFTFGHARTTTSSR